MTKDLLSQQEYLQQLRYIITLQETRQRMIDIRKYIEAKVIEK